jgi:hypothetical protein
MNDVPSRMIFGYSGFGREFTYELTGEEADYLPKAMATFAEFLRAAGFCWVAVDQVEGKRLNGIKTKDYLFRGDYKWDDTTNWAESWYEPEETYFFDDEDEGPETPDDDEEQAVINEAARSYWDQAVETARFNPTDINVGDWVYYHGNGTPDQTNSHGGYKGVDLQFLQGKVHKLADSPLGKRVLVKWNNWYDGHNGMGDVPEAKVSDTSYWWSNLDNLYKAA